MPGHTKCCTCHAKSSSQIWCSKMQPLSGNQRPDLLTALMNMSLVLRLPRQMHLSRSSSTVPRLPSFLEFPQDPRVLLTFGRVQNPLRLPRKTTSELSTSKSGPNMVCFVHFDLEMCFAPQRRALFRHLNFQKWSENGVFYTLWLGNVLRATTACNFSSLIWPHGSKPAALASLLFDPPEPQAIGKHSVSRLFYLLLWLFPPLLFHVSIFSEVWLLNFLRPYSACALIFRIATPKKIQRSNHIKIAVNHLYPSI